MTASDCTFITMLAARTEVFQKHRKLDPDVDEAHINARLVAYCSDQVSTFIKCLLTGTKSYFCFYCSALIWKNNNCIATLVKQFYSGFFSRNYRNLYYRTLKSISLCIRNTWLEIHKKIIKFDYIYIDQNQSEISEKGVKTLNHVSKSIFKWN